jgi:acyl carrier protein
VTNVREALRAWMAAHSRKAIGDAALTDATRLIEEGILSSVQVPDLILFIEDLRGRPVDIAELKPGSFRSVDAIVATFFAEVQ